MIIQKSDKKTGVLGMEFLVRRKCSLMGKKSLLVPKKEIKESNYYFFNLPYYPNDIVPQTITNITIRIQLDFSDTNQLRATN